VQPDLSDLSVELVYDQLQSPPQFYLTFKRVARCHHIIDEVEYCATTQWKGKR